MKILTAVGALALTLTASTAFAQTAGEVASPIDRQFAAEAAGSNMFEITSSQMALQKSRDPAVRNMARWMIQSHTLAGRKLQAAARDLDEGGAVPAVTPSMESMLSELSTLDGAAFDKAYVTGQVASHQLTAQKLDDYRQAGSYGPLLSWDAKTTPEVNAHLVHFEALSQDR